jgi:hypothetical protein
VHECGLFARFRFNDLKGAARVLRQTQTLWRLYGGKGWRRGAAEMGGGVQPIT